MAAATNTSALLFTLLSILLFSSTHGLNLKLIRASSLQHSPLSTTRNTSLSWTDNVNQLQSHDKVRVQFLSSVAAGMKDAHIASGLSIFHNSTYIAQARIGTPPQTLLLAVDTSNDAGWVPCAGCDRCPSTTFNNKNSTTYKRIFCYTPPCYQVPYPRYCGGRACWFTRQLGNSTVDAKLVQDTIVLGSDSISNYIFGCVLRTTGNSFPAQGLLGLGRGPLSLLSQTVSRYNYTFSYCLPSYKSPNFTGSLRLGPKFQPKITKTTPLVSNPTRASLYYVTLLGIKVGATAVYIPPSAFAYNPYTGAGTIVDSGTMFSSLVKSAYGPVRDEVRRQQMRTKAKLLTMGGFDTCYNVSIRVPTMTFMFSGMNVTIPQENFIIRSTYGNTNCLAMAAAPDVNSVLNVIASFQQQNFRVLINPNSVGIVPENCSRT